MSSSSHLGDRKPFMARLNQMYGWVTDTEGNIDEEWIQVDFDRTVVVDSIYTQGCNECIQIRWVKSYRLSYLSDSDNWKQYNHVVYGQVLPGNSDAATVVSTRLIPPIVTRTVKLQIAEIYDAAGLNRGGLRLDMAGCDF
ncbi:unnamed protein product [Owenia fusiformis]|uniref:F5/8 type C domain-containing protein n=1 Tax=Owenia fusiformis TaxID=6347 RepID=A0A8S4MYT5_OWEFU|nr:unnamed protein product [Owenia fusiformis]